MHYVCLFEILSSSSAVSYCPTICGLSCFMVKSVFDAVYFCSIVQQKNIKDMLRTVFYTVNLTVSLRMNWLLRLLSQTSERTMSLLCHHFIGILPSYFHVFFLAVIYTRCMGNASVSALHNAIVNVCLCHQLNKTGMPTNWWGCSKTFPQPTQPTIHAQRWIEN